MNKRVVILVAVLVVLSVLLVVSVTSKKAQAPEVNKKVKVYPTYIPYNVPQTSLWIEQEDPDIKSNETELTLYMNTKENKVKSVQLEIAYDPKVLRYVSIAPEDILGGKHIFLKKIDTINGKISFGVENTPNKKEAPIQGADEIGELIFRKVSTTEVNTEVTILPESIVKADGVSDSVLVDTKGITIQLQ